MSRYVPDSGSRRRTGALAMVAALIASTLALTLAMAGSAAATTKTTTTTTAAIERQPFQLLAGTVTPVDLAGVVPDDATAVAFNVTATDGIEPGYVTLFPCGQPVPEVSNVNYMPADTIANAAIVSTGDGGDVCVFAYSHVHVILDVTGWFTPGSVGPAGPARLVDTRETGQRLTAESPTLEVPLPGMPADAKGAAVNLTVTGPSADGFATIFTCGEPVPYVSNANFRASQTTATAALVPADPGRPLCVYSSSPADVVVDVFGWMAGNGLVSSVPGRLTDTRNTGSLGAGATIAVPVPAAPGSSVSLNVVAVPEGEAGFLTVYPCDTERPNSSSVNYTSRIVPNLAVSLVGSDSTVCVFSSAPTHVVVDWFGTLPADGGFAGITPQRVLDSRETTEHIPIPPGAVAPPNSGTGRRVIYANRAQRMWLVEDDGTVARSYLVSGRAGVPGPGTYAVYSKSRNACSVTCTAFMEYMVRFTVSANGNGIGFHSIPYNGAGRPLQTEAELGQFRSAGCVRQAVADAIFLWEWAPVGTKVVVLA